MIVWTGRQDYRRQDSSLPFTPSPLQDLPCPDHQDREEGQQGAQYLDEVGQFLTHNALPHFGSNLALTDLEYDYLQEERDDDAARVLHQTDHVGLLYLEGSDGEILTDDGDDDEAQDAVPDDTNQC